MAVLNSFFNLFRVLFPRWNFFDHIGYQFLVEYKLSASKNWQRLTFESQKTKLSFFYNPIHNLTLAHVNILEHFVQDIQSLPKNQISQLDSFKMLRSLLSQKILSQKNSAEKFQFRIRGLNANSEIEIFRSDDLQVKENE